jgi:hypothetical protein
MESSLPDQPERFPFRINIYAPTKYYFEPIVCAVRDGSTELCNDQYKI